MNLIIVIVFYASFLQAPQDSVKNHLDQHVKSLNVGGTLISKSIESNSYIFRIKNDNPKAIINVILPKDVCNSEEIYNFIAPGDFLYKSKGKLIFRVGHKLDGNIEVKQFNLGPNAE